MNTLSFGLIFGLLLTPIYILLQLKFFSFLIRLLKLDSKFEKPTIILALIIIEFLNIPYFFKNTNILFSIIALIIILLKIYGLFNLKKWVVYVYVIIAIISEFNLYISIKEFQNLSVFFTSLFSQLFTLGIYYFYVYNPNKERFNN